MRHRLLEANGTIDYANSEVLASATEVIVGTDTIENLKSLYKIAQIVVTFTSSADGRGFSIAAALRERRGYEGKLFAGGQLIPDQLSLAFQCGFDAVIVDSAQWSRYGKASWVNGLNPDISRSYMQSHWSDIESIWRCRGNFAVAKFTLQSVIVAPQTSAKLLRIIFQCNNRNLTI